MKKQIRRNKSERERGGEREGERETEKKRQDSIHLITHQHFARC